MVKMRVLVNQLSLRVTHSDKLWKINIGNICQIRFLSCQIFVGLCLPNFNYKISETFVSCKIALK